jgi:L-aspartate oxidase
VSRASAHPIARTYRAASDRGLDERRRARLVSQLRQTMSEHVGVVRNGPGLEMALAALRALGEEAGDDQLILNMALAAEIITGSALLRTESRGAHYRSDFPDPVASLAHRSAVTLSDIRAIGRRSRQPAGKRLAEELPL